LIPQLHTDAKVFGINVQLYFGLTDKSSKEHFIIGR